MLIFALSESYGGISAIYRVPTVQGKQGNWLLLFQDWENRAKFAVRQGKVCRHRKNILTVIINIRSMLLFLNFKKLASLRLT